MLIALAGLPASGKSVLAAQLKDTLPAIVLDKDSVRDFLDEPRMLIDTGKNSPSQCLEIAMNPIRDFL